MKHRIKGSQEKGNIPQSISTQGDSTVTAEQKIKGQATGHRKDSFSVGHQRAEERLSHHGRRYPRTSILLRLHPRTRESSFEPSEHPRLAREIQAKASCQPRSQVKRVTQRLCR